MSEGVSLVRARCSQVAKWTLSQWISRGSEAVSVRRVEAELMDLS